MYDIEAANNRHNGSSSSPIQKNLLDQFRQKFSYATSVLHRDMMDLILNFQCPIPGIINCSIPFLYGDGDRLNIALSSSSGLPALPPHGGGASISSFSLQITWSRGSHSFDSSSFDGM